jgi:hypothetical protein
MGFSGHPSLKRHNEQLEKALRNGHTVHKHTNTEIVFDGKAERFVTFEGLLWTATGRMVFKHHDTRVMAVDFDRDMITDFGYTGYSMTTDKNLRSWRRALCDAGFQGMTSLVSETNPFRWTSNHDRGPRGAGYAEGMFKRFCARVPWVTRIKGDAWFVGPKYAPVLEDHYDTLRREILSDGVSWHWFTADWNERGQWEKRFIDDAAKKRWEKREAKQLRAEARQAIYDASVEAAAS